MLGQHSLTRKTRDIQHTAREVCNSRTIIVLTGVGLYRLGLVKMCKGVFLLSRTGSDGNNIPGTRGKGEEGLEILAARARSDSEGRISKQGKLQKF
jgi:hypothetical protein